MIRAVASVAWLGLSLSAVHARTPTNPAPSSLPNSGFDFVRIDEVSASRTLRELRCNSRDHFGAKRRLAQQGPFKRTR